MAPADQLREAGYRVVEARDADEALELLQHDGLDVKVVITDIEMPGSMNGIELAGVIRTEYPLAKVLLMPGLALKGALTGFGTMAFFQSPTTPQPLSNVSRRY